MARIRTVKPEFFRHEGLQELGALPMLIFEGLWTQCDNHGRFPWQPRQLKLDILPFINFDMDAQLNRLLCAGFLRKYAAQGKIYGCVPTFSAHQRITGKEFSDGSKYPEPEEELTGNQEGNSGETTEKHPVAQERERERERERDILRKFAQFWTAYPKKRSKGDAEKAFKAINPSEQLLETMISTIERAKTSEQWFQDNGQFIPYPATWLRSRGWEDQDVEITGGCDVWLKQRSAQQLKS